MVMSSDVRDPIALLMDSHSLNLHYAPSGDGSAPWLSPAAGHTRVHEHSTGNAASMSYQSATSDTVHHSARHCASSLPASLDHVVMPASLMNAPRTGITAFTGHVNNSAMFQHRPGCCMCCPHCGGPRNYNLPTPSANMFFRERAKQSQMNQISRYNSHNWGVSVASLPARSVVSRPRAETSVVRRRLAARALAYKTLHTSSYSHHNHRKQFIGDGRVSCANFLGGRIVPKRPHSRFFSGERLRIELDLVAKYGHGEEQQILSAPVRIKEMTGMKGVFRVINSGEKKTRSEIARRSMKLGCLEDEDEEVDTCPPLDPDCESVKTDYEPVKTDCEPVKTDWEPVKTDCEPVKTDPHTAVADSLDDLASDEHSVEEPVSEDEPPRQHNDVLDDDDDGEEHEETAADVVQHEARSDTRQDTTSPSDLQQDQELHPNTDYHHFNEVDHGMPRPASCDPEHDEDRLPDAEDEDIHYSTSCDPERDEVAEDHDIQQYDSCDPEHDEGEEGLGDASAAFTLIERDTSETEPADENQDDYERESEVACRNDARDCADDTPLATDHQLVVEQTDLSEAGGTGGRVSECGDDEATSQCSDTTDQQTIAKITQMKCEAAQRLDNLEKLIDEHQEIVREIKRTQSYQENIGSSRGSCKSAATAAVTASTTRAASAAALSICTSSDTAEQLTRDESPDCEQGEQDEQSEQGEQGEQEGRPPSAAGDTETCDQDQSADRQQQSASPIRPPSSSAATEETPENSDQE